MLKKLRVLGLLTLLLIFQTAAFARRAIAPAPSDGKWAKVMLYGKEVKGVQVEFVNRTNMIIVSTSCGQRIEMPFNYVGRNTVQVDKVTPLKKLNCKKVSLKTLNSVLSALSKVNKVNGDYTMVSLEQGTKKIIKLSNKAESPARANAELNGSYRILNQLENGETVDRALNPSTVNFNAEAKTLNINCGCNNISSNYSLEGDLIKIEGLMATEMYCDPKELMDFEKAISKNFSDVTSYKVEGNKLYLYKEDIMMVMLEKVN